MLRTLLTTTLILSAGTALAVSESQRERAMAAYAGMESRMHAFYIEASPDFAPFLVTMAGDPAMQEVMTCTLQRIEDAGGSALVEEYLAGIELQASREIESIASMSEDMPAVMMSDTALDAAMNCGGPELMQERQMTEEFMEIMMRPEVQERLMGDAN